MDIEPEKHFDELLKTEEYSKRHSSCYRINMKNPDKTARDIRLGLLQKEERRHAQLVAKEVEELKECTFQPTVKAYVPTRYNESKPVIIRGLGRHLELQHLSVKQREEASQREIDAFTVKNVDKYRRPEDGSTIVKQFHFRSS